MKVYHAGCVGLEMTAWLSIMLASTLPQETVALQLCVQMPPSEGPGAVHKLGTCVPSPRICPPC